MELYALKSLKWSAPYSTLRYSHQPVVLHQPQNISFKQQKFPRPTSLKALAVPLYDMTIFSFSFSISFFFRACSIEIPHLLSSHTTKHTIHPPIAISMVFCFVCQSKYRDRTRTKMNMLVHMKSSCIAGRGLRWLAGGCACGVDGNVAPLGEVGGLRSDIMGRW